VYSIEYAGYYCNLGTVVLSTFGLAKCSPPSGVQTYTINGHQATADSLAANTGTSNPSAAPYVPTPPPRPSCRPNYSFRISFNWPPWKLGPCTRKWADYYLAYGVIGVQQLQQVCEDISGLTCTMGFEGELQQYEANWVHGPVNSFPAVYDPVVDAMILASDSTTKEVNAYGLGDSGALKTLAAIKNGSFTLQNLKEGNNFIEPRDIGSCPGGKLCWQSDGMMHGLGTLTVAGSVIEQYNDGLQSAGLSGSRFQLLQLGTSGLWDCEIACYVPSGFRHVVFRYAENLAIDPPAGLLGNISGDVWSVESTVEVPTGTVVPWA